MEDTTTFLRKRSKDLRKGKAHEIIENLMKEEKEFLKLCEKMQVIWLPSQKDFYSYTLNNCATPISLYVTLHPENKVASDLWNEIIRIKNKYGVSRLELGEALEIEATPITPASKLRYDKEYKKNNIKKVSIEFNVNNQEDVELLEFLKSKENKQSYIKSLIKKEVK